MRPIEFRGKRIDTNEWVYGYYVVAEDEHFIIPADTELCTSVDGFPAFEVLDAHKVDPKTVGQFIGPLDKKKQKTYEGDILRWNKTGYIASVRYENGWFVVGEGGEPIMVYMQEAIDDDGFDTKMDIRNSEIIGNVSDNPELMKGQDDD